MAQLNTVLENKDYRDDLFKGMTGYFEFVKTHYPHLSSIHGNLIPFVTIHNACCDKKIGMVGLNSSWMCRHSDDEKKIAIGEFQVKKAMEELDGKGHVDLTINLFHHPLQWLWEDDWNRLKTYLNESIILSGHLHDADGGWVHGIDGSRFCFQAGGAYLGSESKWPARYQYITFNWEADKIRLDFRKYNKASGEWVLDGAKGEDGKKEFPLSLKTKSTKAKTERPPRPKVFDHYLESAALEHRHLPAKGFETTLRVPIEIEKVYVSMRAHINAYDFDNTIHGKECLKKKKESQALPFLDIKGAFKVARNQRIKDIVILGDPGSGKTTLLKYILIMLVDQHSEEKLGISPEIVPFLAPLRELKDPEKESLFEFISRVCFQNGHEIKEDDFKTLLGNKQGIILLDGLDEVADKDLRIKTCQWIDRARKEFVHTSFIITSRFAGYLGESRLEGAVLELSIQDFTIEEVEIFLVRWFETVEATIHPDATESFREKGREAALKLVARIKDKQFEHLKKLAVNPLLLQIIALVHRDRGTLPQRRVELYDECTNVLLEKWDMAKGLETLLSAREARQVLQPVALFLHEIDERRSAPMADLFDGIKQSLESMGKTDIDPEKLMKNIRDRSGIFMGYNETEYGFAHHSFQEYLAAEQIRNADRLEFLVDKYDNRWWREVILLCLALDNPSVIEKFMSLIIPKNHFLSDITIITDAIKDSIIKPIKPFEDALESQKLAKETKENAKMVLDFVKSGSEQIALIINDSVSAQADVDVELVVGGVMSDPQRVITAAKDDSEMVLIPAGAFLFGSREDDKMAGSDEKPQRTIHLDDYYMDLYPVTNMQFCEFLNQVNPNEKLLKKWIYLSGSFQKEKCGINKVKQAYRVEKGYEMNPVIYVSWHGADAYAKWAGKRLPTEQEWEKAARGTKGLIFPWGNEFDPKRCNSGHSKIEMTSPVNQFPEGRSPYGCYDMAGNVWEWTSSLYIKDNYVLRGGSWGDGGTDDFRCAYRISDLPFGRGFDVGFRCART